MAIKPRLRFEIFRRDHHTCRYCFRTEVALTIDHVVPSILGGSDAPTNLVTCCEECNSGKSSALQGGPTVDDVDDDLIRWTRAMKRAAAIAREKHDEVERYREAFKTRWGDWHFTADKRPVPLPDGWAESIDRFCAEGLPEWMWDGIIRRAMSGVSGSNFRCACDLARNKLYELQRRARAEVDGQPDESTFSERIAAQFLESWGDPDSKPSADDLRILDTHARAANAAGYEEVSIACAAYKGAQDCNPGIKAYLDTVDDVFDLERAVGDDGPFGKGGIDRDLIPTQDERDAEIVAEAAVVAWRRAWLDHPDERAAPDHADEQCVREQVRDLYPGALDADEAIQGMTWAGSEGKTDLNDGRSSAKAFSETELAVSAWEHAYSLATGVRSTPEQMQAVWEDLYTLRKNQAWAYDLAVAAVFAGTHGTTRMHCGLKSEQAEAIGVSKNAQLIEDTWARAWLMSAGSAPTESDRVRFRASVGPLTGGRRRGDVIVAALTAGVYQSAELMAGHPWAPSAIDAASNFSLIGGA